MKFITKKCAVCKKKFKAKDWGKGLKQTAKTCSERCRAVLISRSLVASHRERRNAATRRDTGI